MRVTQNNPWSARIGYARCNDSFVVFGYVRWFYDSQNNFKSSLKRHFKSYAPRQVELSACGGSIAVTNVSNARNCKNTTNKCIWGIRTIVNKVRNTNTDRSINCQEQHDVERMWIVSMGPIGVDIPWSGVRSSSTSFSLSVQCSARVFMASRTWCWFSPAAGLKGTQLNHLCGKYLHQCANKWGWR